MIWIIKHMESRDPIFHSEDKFTGAGNCTNVELIAEFKGSFLYVGVNIEPFGVK